MIIEDDYYKKNFDKFSTAVEQLSLNAKILRRLNEMGIKNVGDLIQVNEEYILRTPGLGRTSLTEIISILGDLNLSLNTNIIWPIDNLDDLKLNKKNYFDEPKEPMIQEKSSELKFNKNLLRKVDELVGLSVRSVNCLKNDNIIYIGDLVQKTEGEMLRMLNLGSKSLNEIKEVLSAISLYLGMEIPDWPSPKDIHQKNDTDFIEQNFANLIRSLDEVGFSIRAMTCIKNMGLKIVANLVQTSEKDFIREKNFGRKTLREINNFLGNVGLSLGTQIDWPPENYEALKIRHKEKIEEMLPADKQSLLEKIKSVLKEREALVVNKRFWEGNTLEEIGLMLKVTRERIRQIEAKAMRKTKILCKNYLAKFLEKEKDQIFSKFSASEDLVTSKSLKSALKFKFPLSEYDGLVMFSIEIMHKKIENFFNEKFKPLLGGWYKKQNVDELNNDVEEIIYHLDKKPLPRQCESARVIANVSKENFKNCALIIDSERNYYLIENYFCSRYQKKWGLNSNFYLSRVHYIAFKKSPNKYITYDELLPLVCNDPLLKHTAWAKGKLRMKDMIRGKGLINTEHLFIMTGRGFIPIGKYENYFEGFNRQKGIESENHQDEDLVNNLDIPLEEKENFNIADILKIISNILHKHKVLSVKELSKIYVKKLKKDIIPEQAVRILNILLSGYANFSLVAPGLWSLSEEKVTGSDLLEFHNKYDDVYGVDMYCLFRMADESINSFPAWSYDYEKELCIQGKNKFPKKTYDSLIHISNPQYWNADKKTIDEHLELKKNSIFHINIDYRGSYNISKNKKSITSYELDKVGRAILYLAENEKISAVSLNIFLEKPIYWNFAYSSLGMLSFAGILEPPENKLKSYSQNNDLVLELKEMVIDELIEFGRLTWTKKFGKRIVEMVQNNYDAFVQKENWITENLRFHGKL